MASPRLQDPNFERTVVLVLENADDGTLGLVLNRPTSTSVAEVLRSWAGIADRTPPAVIFEGGPVAPDVAVGLAGPGAGTAASGPIVGDIGLVDLSAAPPGPAAAPRSVRVFAGYAGWAPGQLADELAEGAWFVVDAQESDLVAGVPEDLWRVVLRRQPGSLRMLAAYPADPAMN